MMSDQTGKSSQQRDSESEIARFRNNLGPFVVAAETTRMPMAFCDALARGKPIIFVNQAFLDLTGYGEQEILGQAFDFLLQSGTEQEALTELQTAFEGGRGLETSVRFRCKDGREVWVSIFINPVRNDAGAVVQHFASFVDITKHQRERERLRSVLDEQNRGMQKTLDLVQTIARQTFGGMAGAQAVEAFEGRIRVLSQVHALLGANDWDGVGLRDLLNQTFERFGIRAATSIEGEEMPVQPNEALPLAMAFHELAANAIAHGALQSGGEVDVRWRHETMTSGSQVRLLWRESGGPPVAAPSFRGFGRRLIEDGLARDLGGEVRLSFEPTGVLCEIVMPVEQRIGGEQ